METLTSTVPSSISGPSRALLHSVSSTRSTKGTGFPSSASSLSTLVSILSVIFSDTDKAEDSLGQVDVSGQEFDFIIGIKNFMRVIQFKKIKENESNANNM